MISQMGHSFHPDWAKVVAFLDERTISRQSAVEGPSMTPKMVVQVPKKPLKLRLLGRFMVSEHDKYDRADLPVDTNIRNTMDIKVSDWDARSNLASSAHGENKRFFIGAWIWWVMGGRKQCHILPPVTNTSCWIWEVADSMHNWWTGVSEFCLVRTSVSFQPDFGASGASTFRLCLHWGLPVHVPDKRCFGEICQSPFCLLVVVLLG